MAKRKLGRRTLMFWGLKRKEKLTRTQNSEGTKRFKPHLRKCRLKQGLTVYVYCCVTVEAN